MNAFLLIAATAAAAASPSLDFDRTFSERGEPASLHYQGRYIANGAAHSVEVWRDGTRRLKRSTDDRLTMFVTRRGPGADYRLDMLDKAKKIHTTISRDHMYSIGGFTDWFDMAHALRHPKIQYRLTAGKPPKAGLPAAPAKCGWYDLTQGPQTSHICWDGANRIPLMIVDGKGALVWRVTAVDRKSNPAKAFVIDDRGYVKTDADRDIAAD